MNDFVHLEHFIFTYDRKTLCARYGTEFLDMDWNLLFGPTHIFNETVLHGMIDYIERFLAIWKIKSILGCSRVSPGDYVINFNTQEIPGLQVAMRYRERLSELRLLTQKKG